MFNRKVFIAIATLALGATIGQSALAQGTTTLRTPLIAGEQSTAPGFPAAQGMPPAVGCGPTPWPVTPGQVGPPTLLPWVPAVPANTIGASSSGINLPIAPPIETPPGVLGPLLTGIVPNSPSTPGAAPSMLTAPNGYIVPSEQLLVNQGGGLPGTGGYNTTINKVRRSGQTTQQFEERGFHSIFGGGGNAQDEVTLTGPLSGFGLPFGVPTGNGYNNGPAGMNNDLRNSSIDLGGGQRLLIGGQKISTGSSVQDYGLSTTRNNPIAALNAHQSTEFGQGLRREPIYSTTTTDFGCRFKQFSAANEDAQKTGQLLPPTAVETNF